jgi:hypothetical protein
MVPRGRQGVGSGGLTCHYSVQVIINAEIAEDAEIAEKTGQWCFAQQVHDTAATWRCCYTTPQRQGDAARRYGLVAAARPRCETLCPMATCLIALPRSAPRSGLSGAAAAGKLHESNAPWNVESVSCFIQSILPAARVFAEARQVPETVRESLAHLRRYLGLICKQPRNSKRKATP